MPRIRTLKPEHKQHRKVGRLDDRTYRLWVGLITEADDDGRLVADVDQLRVLIFGYQPETHGALIEDSLSVLLSTGLIHRYHVDTVGYICFPDYRQHQRINRPTQSKLPPCPNCSLSPHGALTEDSRRIGGDQGSRKGSEGRGVQRGGGADVGDGSPTPPRSHAAPSSNGNGPDGWPIDREARKKAMLEAIRLPTTPTQQPSDPFE